MIRVAPKLEFILRVSCFVLQSAGPHGICDHAPCTSTARIEARGNKTYTMYQNAEVVGLNVASGIIRHGSFMVSDQGPIDRSKREG